MSKSGSIGKRIAKIVVILYMVLICLPFFLAALIQTPVIQKIIVDKTTKYLSRELNTEISIGAVYLTFFLDIEIHDIKVNDQKHSPLIGIDKLSVGLSNISFTKKTLFFDKAILIHPVFHLRHDKDEETNNLQFIIDYFSSADPKSKTGEPWSIQIRNLHVRDAEFSFTNENKEEVKEGQIDFNYLSLAEINFHATSVIIADSLYAEIHQLSFSEQSGFAINRFKADFSFSSTRITAKNMLLQTKGTKLSGDLIFQYSDTKDFNDFIHLVTIQADLNKSALDISDIAAFAPDIPIYRSRLFFSGKIEGTISNFSAKDFVLETGRSSSLNMNCMIMGLPDINETFFDFNIKTLNTNSEDIISIIKGFNLKVTSLREINTLASFNIRGSFIGFTNSFYSDFNLNSNIGSISGKMSFKNNDNSKPTYSGSMSSTAFDLGKLLDNSSLGIITSELELNGEGLTPETMNLNSKGTISEFFFNNYIYNNIVLDAEIKSGLFDVNININDPNIRFSFNGKIKLTDSVPSYLFAATIKDARLNELHLSRKDSASTISAALEANGTGVSIDEFIGQLKISNITYSEGNKKFTIKQLEINQNSLSDSLKRIGIESDFANGYIEGKYTFNNLPIVFNSFLSDYISSLEPDTLSLNSEIHDFNFRFSFNIKNFEIISGLFLPDLHIADNTVASGNFDSKFNTLFSTIISDNITYNNVRFNSANINIETFSNNIYLTAYSVKILFNDSISIENFIGSGVLSSDNINFSLFWNNYDETSNTSGDIKGFITFPDSSITEVRLMQSNFTFENRQWQIGDENSVRIVDNMLLVNNFRLSHNEQSIRIHGIASPLMTDNIHVTFNNFKFDNHDPLFSIYNLDINGKLNGNVELKNVFSGIVFTSDLIVEDFVFEDKTYGNLYLKSTYNHQKQSLYADISEKTEVNNRMYEPMSVQGNYYFNKPGNELDFKCKLSAFDLRLIEPFLAGQIKIIEGKTTGDIIIKGDVKNPDINGKIWFIRTIAQVNYLNTLFVLKDTIHITSKTIYSENFHISDVKGKNAYANIMIKHNNFSDLKLDIKLRTEEDFVFMNTGPGDNESFYGTIIADGYVYVTGKPDNIIMNVSAKTGKGTQFYLPMNSTGNVYENNFITFTGIKSSDENASINPLDANEPGFVMNLDMEVTPDAEMQIIFDPKIGDIMRGKAKGNLRINFDMNGDFIMYGDIELVEGDYLFTLENIINKKFFIYPGGTIKWEGNPYNAIIDIQTYYPIRTRLFELVSHIDSSDVYRKKIPVNLELALKNNLMTPDIAFNITLPQADENTKNIMKSAISSDQELNRQVFSLLILNSFVQPESSFSTPLTQGMGTTSFEFFSNQFSNWLSQISKDFDIGVNYRQGSELSTDEVEVMVSTQLFNDRIRIEGNLGVGGNQVGNTDNTHQNVMGDVTIENRLTPDGRISLRAFNRSNPIDAIAQNSPYTQGVGITFRKDFDTFRDLFKNDRKKRKKLQKEEPTF